MIARIIGFFKTPAGGAILFLIAMFTFFYFVRSYRENKAMETASKEGVNVLGRMSPEALGADPDAAIISEWVKESELEKFNPPADKTQPTPRLTVTQTAPDKPAPLPELIHFFKQPKGEPPAPDSIKPPRTFAPMGTRILRYTARCFCHAEKVLLLLGDDLRLWRIKTVHTTA